jgi:hypothetical protein
MELARVAGLEAPKKNIVGRKEAAVVESSLQAEGVSTFTGGLRRGC